MVNLSKRLVREHAIKYRNYPVREYAIEISSAGIAFRERGKRTWFGAVPWERILGDAFRLTAAEEDRRKLLKRRGIA